MTDLAGDSVVVVGGGSGIGLAVARRALGAGADVVLGGRTAERLERAAATLGDNCSWSVVDTTDQDSLETFFARQKKIDHLFISGAEYQVGSITELTPEAAESPFRTKFWGQYHAVRHAIPRLADDGSIVLMAGAASVRPPAPASAYVACNAAIDGLGRGLAFELAPIRVNVVSPGTIDGSLRRGRDREVREASFAQYARDTLLHRVGTEDEVADAVLYLFRSTYTTGSTLYPDGGYALR